MSSCGPTEEIPVYWCPEKKRLVFLKEEATPEYWDKQWQTDDWKKKITGSRHSWYWSGLLRKYLPDKRSVVLEGGCGYGHLVDAMNHWGYRAIGIDFAPETIAKIKEVMPELDVRIGDVRSLPLEDGCLDGYWSLGVIEHFWEGYNDILREISRVVRPSGYAFVSFPCVSHLDRLKIHFHGYRTCSTNDRPDNFYQFGLSIGDVKKDFEQAGFRCLRIMHNNCWMGLERISPAFNGLHSRIVSLASRNLFYKAIMVGMDSLLAPICGHSALLVLRKN